ncbi:unnamed protein product [Paramecium pentaurelia]|uniref:Uncharacterized protein n=1 Tax=Paramecium pentaurelia TaxID=43138 RepID=A0A8S1VGJ0_9CILI|nr:unnamed protein product [Paramecium pentaurelia]
MHYDKMLLAIQNIFSKFDKCQQKQMLISFIFLILIGIWILFLCYYSKQNRIYRKKLILIGPSGVGKTKLFNIATDKKVYRKQINQDQFYEFPIGNNLDLVDTPSIEFDDSITKREAIIKQFNSYFKLNFYQIEKFYLIVNFERTDIMKQNCLKVYKYFKKFSSIIDIVITNFQLSEDEIEDKENLVKAFRMFINDQKKVHFVRDDIQSEELKQLFIQSANLIDLQDINFEMIKNREINKNEQNQTQQIFNGKQYQSIDEFQMNQEQNFIQIL